MDILYIIGGSTVCSRFDLRCSLRSVAEHARGIDRVFVAGECPDWLSDEVVKVPFDQPCGNPCNIREKHINMMATLLYVVENTDVSEDFVVSSADHFLTKTIHFPAYPYYMKLTDEGTSLPKSGKTAYNRALAETRTFLEEHGLPARYMTLHRDMRMTKSAVLACKPLFDEVFTKGTSVEPFAVVGNYMIANCGIKPRAVHDYKIFRGSEWWKSSPDVTDTFSTTTLTALGGLLPLVAGKYPTPSKYEN